MHKQPKSTKEAFTSVKTPGRERLLNAFFHQRKQLLLPVEPILMEEGTRGFVIVSAGLHQGKAPPSAVLSDLP